MKKIILALGIIASSGSFAYADIKDIAGSYKLNQKLSEKGVGACAGNLKIMVEAASSALTVKVVKERESIPAGPRLYRKDLSFQILAEGRRICDSSHEAFPKGPEGGIWESQEECVEATDSSVLYSYDTTNLWIDHLPNDYDLEESCVYERVQ